jgi:K+-sensing histidine kinase KdpD
LVTLVRACFCAPRRPHAGNRRSFPLAVCASAVALTTTVLAIADPIFGVKHSLMGYLLPVTVIAIQFGTPFATLTSVASAIAAAFFLFPPQISFEIADLSDFAVLGFFTLLALVTGKAFASIHHGDRLNLASADETASPIAMRVKTWEQPQRADDVAAWEPR